jgi:hypothetical protein
MNKTAMITHVEGRRNGKAPGFPVVVFLEVKTEEGKMLLKMTGEAAHELRALLTILPPRIGKEPDLKKLGKS